MCPVCHALLELSDGPVCRKCVETIIFFRDPLCCRCGRTVSTNCSEKTRCEKCAHEEFQFDRLCAGGVYEGGLKECIHAFKFGKKEHLGKWFADTMVSCLPRNAAGIRGYDLVVPVPMHPVKKKERGFNQAEVLSRHLSDRLGIPYRFDVLRRKNEGRVQSSLSRKERFLNVEAVFALHRPGLVRGRACILVDDIYTTGATAGACAALLKRGGAQNIAVLVVARSI